VLAKVESGGYARRRMFFLTPKWKKEAKLLAKGAQKFLHYKRDLLKPDRVAEINSRRSDLLDAIRSRDLTKVSEASKQLRATCENALPHEQPTGWFEENVEVMFVAIVIALGLRAYYLQPFRIPTGSMMPTLNGITATPAMDLEKPALPVRVWKGIVRGRTYVKVVNDRDRTLLFDAKTSQPVNARGGPALSDFQWFHFFSRSRIEFADSPPLRLPAPINPMREIGLDKALRSAFENGGMHNNGTVIEGVLKKGTVIAEGYLDTGDLVLVDKVSYHFRKPRRGEVFVFDTIDIAGIHQASGDQAAGSHYIKRLCGVPGDSLFIVQPNVLNHGQILQEPGIQRVAQAQGIYGPNPEGPHAVSAKGQVPGAHGPLRAIGYVPAVPSQGYPNPRLTANSPPLELRVKARPGQREYAALGDNTGNSLDSRYWGTVKEFNLVGPALFSLWPFTTGHWGFID
jgi:signal peptidase I